jgi:hypothetical protein
VLFFHAVELDVAGGARSADPGRYAIGHLDGVASAASVAELVSA